MKRRVLPVVIDIAEPCPAAWEAMLGDAHRRFCDQCEKRVINLSTVPTDEVAEVIRSGACISFEFRPDASVVTAPSRARRAVPAIVMAAALAASVGCDAVRRTTGEPPPAPSAPQPAVAASAIIGQAPLASASPSASAAEYSGDPPPQPKTYHVPVVPKHRAFRTAGLVAPIDF
jgi:hypothetical protein